MTAPPVRILRIIARMNLGGPSYQVTMLTTRLDERTFESLLLAGKVGSGEEAFDAAAQGARWHTVPGLGPEIRPWDDLRALRHLVAAVRAFRPDIVHTHAAKAGTLGRLAAVLARKPRPILVHTYHGHVLTGYFGPATSAVYRTIERLLARVSDCLIGVGQATVDELVALRIAPRERFRVIRLGLDLDRFLDLDRDAGTELRAQLGVSDDEVLATFVGRLVPIKRVDLLLEAVAAARARGAPVRLLVVGDGSERDRLRVRAAALGLDDAASFVGYRRDLEAVVGATDIAVLSSDNEGTPVSLIEAAAGARPAVSTDVGAVREVVTTESGVVVPPRDVEAFAAALVELAADPERRRVLGERGREHVAGRFTAPRLLRDVEELYDELLAGRARP